VKKEIQEYFEGASKTMQLISDNLGSEIQDLVSILIECLNKGGTIFWCGNGGSAADSQHLAAELIGKFKLDRAPLRSIALTTDTSILTATANDFGFVNVFSRQIEGLGRPGDVLIGITTSGLSENIFQAVKKAKVLNMKTILFCGEAKTELRNLVDITIAVPSSITSHIQEGHIAIGQLACGLVEEHFFG
jgi:D-sedoheptulose 7-phosphate isomerase